MNSNDTARAIARALALAGTDCHVYAHDLQVQPDGTETAVDAEQGIELPAILVRVKCQSLAGSASIGKARIEIDVESQVDDSTVVQHAARETFLRCTMADQAALVNAFAFIRTVRLLGKPCLVENDPETENRAFKTPFNYAAGVAAIS
jgi:hypothetical protein